MGLKERYEKAKTRLLNDQNICKENRAVFEEFFKYQEYKLKRQNGLPKLDDGCYRTLSYYITRFKNVNTWFENKPWQSLTKEDIKNVYDKLEDGIIKTKAGKPFIDRSSYYNKVFKSKPFRIVQKSELAKEVIEFSIPEKRVVRFITEETFLKMTQVVSNQTHLTLLWLAWDIGENIDAILKLTKSDFTRQINIYTKEPEYLVHLKQAIIKRSRQTRSEPTLYATTIQHLDILLPQKDWNEKLFNFEHRQALKIIHQISRKSQAKSQPLNEPVIWKDLRSGMACHLLKNGWYGHEVSARLGHVPGSKALQPYINYLALDRGKPKQKLQTASLEQLRYELEESQQREKHTARKLLLLEEQNNHFAKELISVKNEIQQLITLIKTLPKITAH